jgi:hypothetical protein
MEGNKVSTVDTKEKELDCVISLHNFKQLMKMDPLFDIPERRNAISDEHLIRPLIPPHELDLKIPPEVRPNTLKKNPHLEKFKNFLTSASNAIEKALGSLGEERIFFPNVRKRGRNLYEGAYVLQLRVQEESKGEGLNLWTVQFLVGASYSYETYKGYFQMTKDSAVINNICQCYSGYVPKLFNG